MRLFERRMSLCLFNLFGAGRPLARSTGVVLATASDSHLASGTKQPADVGPLPLPRKRLPRLSATPPKPLCADQAVTQGRHELTGPLWVRPEGKRTVGTFKFGR